ncbi:SPFH domain-containing protein [Clostridium sp. AM58-1XD]|uniref:SPFH domain-containing protein n=1 Tax=Clostridium sp. AM58-1XD TaxID=2292307 RepID=UPI00242041F0|nr:SPFH domain-containing protein [Clostridium sp. AM58-1XD]
MIVSQVKANFARTIKENQINVLELDSYLDVLAESLKNLINPALEEYGLVMPEFYITTIMTPDQDPNFQRLKLQFAEKTLRVREEEIRQKEAEAMQSRKIIEAQTEAQLKLVNAQSEAQALKIKAMAEAEAYRLQALAEAEEMKAKGYTYQQETARQVGLEALQNGITGGGSSASSSGSDSPLGAGTFHDIASLGITLGAMGGIINMTKDVLTPVFETSESIGSSVGNVISGKSGSWDCPCGAKNNTSRFCPECGARRPDSPPGNLWDCSCGAKNIASRFCPECGAKREDEMK